MAFTRTQAKSLLNQTEMGLYDDSRANALRGLSAGELDKRIVRARKARDRARDLLQRQRLASRTRTGSKGGGDANRRSKRKVELLADVLERFEGQRKLAKPAATKSAKKTSGKTAKTAAKKAPGASARKTAKQSSKPAPETGARKSAKKAAAKPARKASAAAASKAKKPAEKAARQPAEHPSRTAAQKGAGKPARRSGGKSPARAGPISPGRALGNTRKLLEAKQARERRGQPWQTLDPEHDHLPQAGYQSGRAAQQAEDLHAGESRIAPIQGSISTRDRKHQGRRDHRNDPA